MIGLTTHNVTLECRADAACKAPATRIVTAATAGTLEPTVLVCAEHVHAGTVLVTRETSAIVTVRAIDPTPGDHDPAALLAAARVAIDTIGGCAYDVGGHFTCTEADALADLMRAAGDPDAAEHWLNAHAEGDDDPEDARAHRERRADYDPADDDPEAEPAPLPAGIVGWPSHREPAAADGTPGAWCRFSACAYSGPARRCPNDCPDSLPDADPAAAVAAAHDAADLDAARALARLDADQSPDVDHDTRPDDSPEPGDRCRTCGAPVTWDGPGPRDWRHADA